MENDGVCSELEISFRAGREQSLTRVEESTGEPVDVIGKSDFIL